MRNYRARNIVLPSRWIYGYFYIKDRQACIINEDGNFFVIAKTQGQYTSLKVNGKEKLYEDDIIELVGKDCERFRIIFSEGAYLAQNKKGTKDLFELLESGHCVLVGNIHEDPQLLRDVT